MSGYVVIEINKEYKSGREVWTTYVLEAKIVTENGFSISLATQWIENPTDKVFDKQDSENKAFKRLAQRLKIYSRQRHLMHREN